MKQTENMSFSSATKYFWKIVQQLPTVISPF